MRILKIVLILLMAIAFTACGGGSNSDDNKDTEQPDDEQQPDDIKPGGPCLDEITIGSTPAETNEKEFLLTFDVGNCKTPVQAWVLNGLSYYMATELSPGSFRRYVPMQKGDNTLRISVKDGDGQESVTKSVVVKYTESEMSQASGNAMVFGSVFEEGSESPIEGARIFVRGIAGVASSDSKGEFSLSIPEGRRIVTIEMDGFTFAQRWINASSDQYYSLAPAYLLKADTKKVTFSSTKASELVNSAGDITIKAPAGAATRAVDVSAISFPKHRSLPRKLPDSSAWTQAFEAFPEGVRFDKPVDVKQDNLNDFPPGFKVPVGYYNRDKGAWEPMGMAVVSADGKWLEFETDHFSPYDINSPVNPRDQASNGSNDKDDCEKGTRGSSIVDDIGGQLSLYHPVSSYVENDSEAKIYLAYNSGRAAGEVDVVVPLNSNSTDEIEKIAATVDFGGNRKEVETQADSGGDFLVATRFFNRRPDQTVIDNGLYPARVELTKYEYSTYMSASVFGGGGLDDSGVKSREALPFSVRKAIPAIVDAHTENPYGNGWDLSIREWVSFHDKLGLGLWHRGGRRPESFITGLPTGDPVKLPEDVGSHLLAIEFDDSGHLFFLNEDGELYIAESLDNAGSANLIEAEINGSFLDIVSNGNEMLAIDDSAVLYRIVYPDTVESISNIGQAFIMDQVQGMDTGSAIDILYPEAGLAVDKDGYIWMIGVGIVMEDEESLYFMPLMVRVDISGSDIAFEKSVLMQLSEWQVPGSLSYDNEEHALYYLFYSEDLLRRFDCAGRNESIIMKEESFVDDSFLALMRGNSGDSYVLAGEKLTRLSPDGVVTVMANSQIEQLINFNGQIFGVGLAPDGQALFAFYDEDYRFSLTKPNYNQGYFPDRPTTVLRDDNGATMTGSGETRSFNAQGDIESIVGKDGRTRAYNYADGLLSSYTSPYGHVTTFTYQNDKIATIKDPGGRIRTLDINNDFQLMGIVDDDASEISFNYDEQNRMTARYGGAGRIDYVYDSLGSIEEVQLDTGETRTFTSLLQAVQPAGIGGGDALWSTMIDGEGHVHQTHYGLNGQVDRYRLNDEEFLIERLVETISGSQTATVTGDAGEIAVATIDSHGRLIDLISYGTQVASSLYDDEYGEEEHNLRGRSCSVYFMDEYDEYYCDGRYLYIYHDENGILTYIEDDYGEQYTIDTDDFGNITGIVDPLGYTATLLRDQSGNVISTMDTAGRQIAYTYNHNNIVQSITDDIGAVFSAEITRSATCDGCETSGKDILETITDPFGNKWKSGIGADGKITSVSTPLGNKTSFTYSGNRMLESVADPDGLSASYEHDAKNRLTSATMGDLVATYEYNNREHLMKAESDEFLMVWERDYESKQITETVTHKTSGHSHSHNTTYDPLTGLDSTYSSSYGENWDITYSGYPGEDTRISDGDLEVSSQIWAGRFSNISVTNENRDWLMDQSVTLDSIERVEYMSWTTEVDSGYLTYSYTGGHREPDSVESDSVVVDSLLFEYDAIGRIVSQTQSETVTFSYDLGSRIESSSYAGNFIYDKDWRLIENGLARYTYFKSGARKTRVDKTSGEKWTYEFNAIGQLTQVQKFATETSSSAYSKTSLFYDPLNRLTVVETDGNSTFYHWYDYVLMAEFDNNGDLLRSYIPSLGLDGLAVIKEGGNAYFTLIDENGSVLRLFDDAGAVVASYNYDSYGRVLDQSGVMANQPRRFAGALWLESIGLYYMRTRYMDPEIGQFISLDPVWKLKIEAYMYCDGRPHQCTDPMGLEGALGGAGSLAGGQIKGGLQNAMGPAGTAWQVYDALSGYKRGDAHHNASNGMRKIASVTFLDKSPAYRRIMDKVEGFWGMMKGDKDDDKSDETDPCD